MILVIFHFLLYLMYINNKNIHNYTYVKWEELKEVVKRKITWIMKN